MNASFDDALPLLPYNGTSGWSGSDASRERAERNDTNGTTAVRQGQVLKLVRDAGSQGLTWSEAGQILGMHHGTVSGALSVLHRQGLINRLSEKRNRSSVYVSPEFTNGRQTTEYKSNVSTRVLTDILIDLELDLLNGNIETARKRIRTTLEGMQHDIR